MSNRIREAGKHDYSGYYGPNTARYWPNTFSVGLFQWMPNKDGGDLKKGKVIARIFGSPFTPDEVYAEAERCCDLLDAGQELGFKTKRVWE